MGPPGSQLPSKVGAAAAGALPWGLPGKMHFCRQSCPCAPSIRPPARLCCPVLPFIPPIAAGPGLKVLPNGQLRLLRASPEDMGTYLCVARNPLGTAVGRTRLIVQGKGSDPDPRVHPLLCSAPSPAPRGETWLSRGEQVPALLPHPVPPVITAGPPELAVLEGLEVLLPCDAHGIPEPRVSWNREGSPVRGGGGKATVLPSGELLLRDVRVSTISSCSWAGCEARELANKCLLLLKRKPRLFCTLPCPWAGAGGTRCRLAKPHPGCFQKYLAEGEPCSVLCNRLVGRGSVGLLTWAGEGGCGRAVALWVHNSQQRRSRTPDLSPPLLLLPFLV